jgi:hypothetical protein
MGSPSAARVGVGGRAVWGHKKAITHASGHEAEAEEGLYSERERQKLSACTGGAGGGAVQASRHKIHTSSRL